MAEGLSELFTADAGRSVAGIIPHIATGVWRAAPPTLFSAHPPTHPPTYLFLSSPSYTATIPPLPQGLPVAVKSLLLTIHSSDESSCDPDKKAHGVLMEAALSKTISHPNVVATYSCDLRPITVCGGRHRGQRQQHSDLL